MNQKIKSLIKKYSDFIRYPIKMDITERKLKDGTESEYEDYIEEITDRILIINHLKFLNYEQTDKHNQRFNFK